jgi:hypothetical protein
MEIHLATTICTFVNILFDANVDNTLSKLNAIEILLDRVIFGITWKADVSEKEFSLTNRRQSCFARSNVNRLTTSQIQEWLDCIPDAYAAIAATTTKMRANISRF